MNENIYHRNTEDNNVNHECSERKKILLGISGGIAAYKTPIIVRLLKSQGAEVKIVMTPAAKDFVTPLTLSTLSNHPVYSTFTEQLHDNPVWNDHGNWVSDLLSLPCNIQYSLMVTQNVTTCLLLLICLVL